MNMLRKKTTLLIVMTALTTAVHVTETKSYIDGLKGGTTGAILAGIAGCAIAPYAGQPTNLALFGITATTGLVTGIASTYKKEINKKVGTYGYTALQTALGTAVTLIAIRTSDPKLLPETKKVVCKVIEPVLEKCISGATFVADRVTSIFFTGR